MPIVSNHNMFTEEQMLSSRYEKFANDSAGCDLTVEALVQPDKCRVFAGKCVVCQRRMLFPYYPDIIAIYYRCHSCGCKLMFYHLDDDDSDDSNDNAIIKSS